MGPILVVVLIVLMLGGFSGRFGGYGYGFGHGGMPEPAFPLVLKFMQEHAVKPAKK